MREDVPRKDFTREEILSNAPEADGRFFIVPKIV
jgi:aspartyl-tRNA(Asn)/glutamyl-tRNA(Gln) amidotransferase subunit C